MATRLKHLRLDEVSLVDAGANQHAHIALYKRDFSTEERRAAAASGAALPDGSFPIKTRADLENAVHAFGRAGNKAQAKAHIISRARALGCTDCLPDGWDVSKSIVARIVEASDALFKGAVAILTSEKAINKAAVLGAAFVEFNEYLAGIVPVEIGKADLGLNKGDGPMAMSEAEKKAKEKEIEDAKKAFDLAKAALVKAKGGSKGGEEKDGDDEGVDDEHKETKKLLAAALAKIGKLERAVSIAKLSPIHQDFMDAQNWDDREKQNFLEKTPEERDEHINKNPIMKAAHLPESVKTILAKAEADSVILKALQEKDEIATFEKKAVGLGLEPAHGEVLRKAYSGDKAGIAALEKLMKGLVEQRNTGALFSEFGSSLGGGGVYKALDEMEQKTLEYMKAHPTTGNGKPMTKAIAFSKVYTDPANADLKKRYDADEFKKRQRALDAA